MALREITPAERAISRLQTLKKEIDLIIQTLSADLPDNGGDPPPIHNPLKKKGAIHDR